MTPKEFLIKRFPPNKYFDCPVPKQHWEIMEKYAKAYHAAQPLANVKRSNKEQNALKCAYEVCLLVHENSGNVIAGSTNFEDIEADVNWYNQAFEFINWYESLYGRTQLSQKKISV